MVRHLQQSNQVAEVQIRMFLLLHCYIMHTEPRWFTSDHGSALAQIFKSLAILSIQLEVP